MLADVLDTVAETGRPWGLLHHAEEIARAQATSDADVVAQAPVGELVGALLRLLRIRDLALVMVWPYDVGSASLFVVRRDRPGGAQLDVTVDERGRGKYGLRAPRFLARMVAGPRWPEVDPVDGLVYRVVKQHRKGNTAGLERSLEEVARLGRDEVIARAGDLLAPFAAARVSAIVSSAPLPRDRPVVLGAAGRIVSRLAHPVGAWAHADGESPVADLAAAFRGVIPHVRVVEPGEIGLRDILEARFRAGLALSSGRSPALLRPDVRYPGGRAGYAALVAGLERRVEERLTKW